MDLVEGLLNELDVGLGGSDFIRSTKSTGCENDPIRPPRYVRHAGVKIRSAMQAGRMCEALAIKVAYLASFSVVKQAERLAPGLHCTANGPPFSPYCAMFGAVGSRNDVCQVA